MVFLNHVNEHSYPEEQLPEWPEPMHVFASPELKIKLSEDTHYAAVRSTANGAPFRSITVRDTIGDLPAVGNAGTGKETFPPPLLTLNQWGFPDGYKFAGNIHKKHRQIGNAVPPPLAFALETKQSIPFK
ncbi:hypothetical protein LWI28_016310 [Acer negundo]|uniref:DNA (cytosine-5-)-methyltransferase n=1 Tax=Acer negundo TaxID=4023 RepID=A0AAD5IAH3_ACENE|nr:hypothetical protein LWI28_016310 [Acer negundo]